MYGARVLCYWSNGIRYYTNIFAFYNNSQIKNGEGSGFFPNNIRVARSICES